MTHRASLVLMAALLLGGAAPTRNRAALHRHQVVVGAEGAYANKVADLAADYLGRICLGRETDTLLSMLVHESGLQRSKVGDDGHSFGLGQVLVEDEPVYRRFWALRGVKLPGRETTEAQVAVAVAAFSMKLRRCHGNVWWAVKRYNGAGRRAREYADRVMGLRAAVFDRPYRPGERADYTECGRRPK